MIRAGSNATMAMMQARPERVAGGRPRIEKIKLKVVQQVANETGYFVPKYGQDTRPQAPDGRMKLGKKPRNIGPHTCPDVPEGLGEKPIKGSGGNRTCKIRLACPQQPNLYLEPKWLRCLEM